MARYKVNGNWSLVERYPLDGVVIESCDLTDTRNGDVFRDGAHRVRITRKIEGFRTKTFKGETAWSDAQRYALDAVYANRRAA